MYPPWVHEQFDGLTCTRCQQPIGWEALELIGLEQTVRRLATSQWPITTLEFNCRQCGLPHHLTLHVPLDDLLEAITVHYHRHAASDKSSSTFSDVPFDTPPSSRASASGRLGRPMPPIRDSEVKRFIAKLRPLDFRRRTKRFRGLMRLWGIDPDAPS